MFTMFILVLSFPSLKGDLGQKTLPSLLLKFCSPRGEGHLPARTLSPVPMLSPGLLEGVLAVPTCDTEWTQRQIQTGRRDVNYSEITCRTSPNSHSTLTLYTDIQPPEVSASPVACVIGTLGLAPEIPEPFLSLLFKGWSSIANFQVGRVPWGKWIHPAAIPTRHRAPSEGALEVMIPGSILVP